MKIQVENNPNLVRDKDSGAIINTDKSAYKTFMASKKKREADQEKINQLEDRLGRIETLLTALLEKETK